MVLYLRKLGLSGMVVYGSPGIIALVSGGPSGGGSAGGSKINGSSQLVVEAKADTEALLAASRRVGKRGNVAFEAELPIPASSSSSTSSSSSLPRAEAGKGLAEGDLGGLRELLGDEAAYRRCLGLV